MNDQQRAAIQMAWEYIDWMLSGNLSEPAHEALDVEAALREALAQPQGEWVELGGGDWRDALNEAKSIVQKSEPLEALFQEFGDRLLSKFKEKNAPPVVPQGEPVANDCGGAQHAQ